MAAFLVAFLYMNLQKFSQAKKKKNKVREFFKNGHFSKNQKCPKMKSTDGNL